MNHPNPQPGHSEIDQDVSDDAIIGVAFKWSLAVLVGLSGLALIGWWFFRESADRSEERVFENVVPQFRTAESELPELPLTDVTREWGVDFVHETGATGEKLLPETMGSGVAVFDYDGDQDQDLFFVNSNRWSWDDGDSEPATCRMFQNDGSGNFEDVTESTVADLSLYGMGAATGDYDNDGDVDLFVTAVGSNVLLRNDGGKFTEVTNTAGVAGESSAWSTSSGFFDYDRDGLLDLFVCNYVTWDREADLSQNFTLDGVNRAYGPPRAFTGSFSYLYHNEGNGTFRDVSEQAGIQVRNADTDVPLGKAMGMALIDANRDGWLDVVVANDTVRNFLFENQQDGTFAEVGQLCGIAYDRSGMARGAMGIDCVHFRDDGTVAIGIGNFANEASALYMARPGRNLFIDAAISTGFGPPTRQGLTFGLFFFDVDLDGRQDVFGANGHLEEEIAKTQQTQRYAQPPQLFWNAGREAESELVAVDASHAGDEFFRPIVGRGAAYGDFDGDGDQDLVVSTSGGEPKVFRNDQATGHHFVRVRLRGTQANRDAIGSLVTVTSGASSMNRMVTPTKSYLSQCELPLTFGLGEKPTVDRVTVRWPGGDEEEFEISETDRTVELVQGEGISGSVAD